MRVLIVDDEPLARRGVRARLAAIQEVEIAGECASGRDAIAAIERDQPDVVMLDVQMPEVDGFGVIDAVGPDRMPLTIFVTAFDAHAIRAFDANALDYLLKPIDDERFRVAIERARTRLAESGAGRARRLEGALSAAPDRRLVLRDGSRVLLVDPGDVDWLGADGDYVRVHVQGRSHLLRHTMAAMEARLDATRFARVHRSAIVNLSRVSEIRRRGDRDYQLVLTDGTKLKLGRTYRSRIEAHLTSRP
jgi:two-component system LytT family response regulator